MDNDNDVAPPKGKRMTMVDKKAAYSMMVALTGQGTPPNGVFSAVAAYFSVHRSTCMRLWKQIQKELPNLPTNNDNDDDPPPDNVLLDRHIPPAVFDTRMSERRKGKCKHNREELQAKVALIPFSKRRRTRMLAAQLEIPQSSLMCILKEKGSVFRRHTNSLKPKLTEANQLARLQHALSKIDLNALTSTTRQESTTKFLPLMDEVHVDEKWFFLCRDGESYIIIYGEEPPKRYVSHKSHITKVMFLCAQARPRMLPNRQWWDGKIGIWPIGEYTVAQRTSVNRAAGTDEFQKQCVDRDKYRTMMINDVVPAIQSKFPTCEQSRYGTIYIQQDGAPSHIPTKNEDDMWYEEMETLGLTDSIVLVTQPPNSPDVNINDLGFFNALQSMHHSYCPMNSLELIEMVTMCYNEYPTNKINRIWLTYQSCLNEIIKCNGHNNYKIPHMNKDKLERTNRLPLTLEVCEEGIALLEAQGTGTSSVN